MNAHDGGRDPSVHLLSGSLPRLADPVLIMMLTGWIDAGGAAARAMAAITAEIDAQTVAVFDEDTYLDYRARRPTMMIRDGLNSVLEWQRITLAVGSDQTGRDLVVLSGPEPDMGWHRFTDAVVQLARELGVTTAIGLGAYPFTAPHTRPCRLSVTSPSADVLARLNLLRSSVDVPAGVISSLEHGLHAHAIPALTIWAQVPHYIANGSYPTASIALIDTLRVVADIVIDAADLRADAIAQSRRLDDLVRSNPEHRRFLEQLEVVHDQTEDTWQPGGTAVTGPTLQWASGDELADELERFLREQG